LLGMPLHVFSVDAVNPSSRAPLSLARRATAVASGAAAAITGSTSRRAAVEISPRTAEQHESDSDSDNNDGDHGGDDDASLVSAHFAATQISSHSPVVASGIIRETQHSQTFQGDALVGAMVSILDMRDDREQAKVIMYCGNGQYMVRTNTMQFAVELDAGLRRRDCWIVAKPPAK
jgi:hypothetical protein